MDLAIRGLRVKIGRFRGSRPLLSIPPHVFHKNIFLPYPDWSYQFEGEEGESDHEFLDRVDQELLLMGENGIADVIKFSDIKFP